MDSDHFSLADSVVNANSGNPVSIATTSAGSFRITTPSVAGVSAGSGTIGISSKQQLLLEPIHYLRDSLVG